MALHNNHNTAIRMRSHDIVVLIGCMTTMLLMSTVYMSNAPTQGH